MCRKQQTLGDSHFVNHVNSRNVIHIASKRLNGIQSLICGVSCEQQALGNCHFVNDVDVCVAVCVTLHYKNNLRYTCRHSKGVSSVAVGCCGDRNVAAAAEVAYLAGDLMINGHHLTADTMVDAADAVDIKGLALITAGGAVIVCIKIVCANVDPVLDFAAQTALVPMLILIV